MIEILHYLLKDLKLWNNGIFLIMGSAGFISSTVAPTLLTASCAKLRADGFQVRQHSLRRLQLEVLRQSFCFLSSVLHLNRVRHLQGLIEAKGEGFGFRRVWVVGLRVYGFWPMHNNRSQIEIKWKQEALPKS